MGVAVVSSATSIYVTLVYGTVYNMNNEATSRMKPKFTKMEYTATHPLDRDDKTPSSLWLDSDTQQMVLWGGKKAAIPEIGDTVALSTPIKYMGTVADYHVSYGWVGIKVVPDDVFVYALSKSGYGNLKEDHAKNPKDMLVWNYGNDLIVKA
jgi:hypothetical protein